MTTEPENSSNKPKKSLQINALRILLLVAVIAFLACGTLLISKSHINQSGLPFDTAAKMATPPGNGPTDLRVGAQIPDFPIRKFGTHEWPKLSQIPGKVIMINFWASWCEACIQEMPSIIKLREAYKGKGLSVIAINLDESPNEAIPKTIRKLKIDFPVYTDPEGKVAEIFDVHAIPLTILLDSQRRILLLENAELDWDSAAVRAKIEKWLHG